MTDFILQKITAFPRPNGAHAKISLLVDSHQKDEGFLFKVADLLVQKGTEVEINKESSDPIRSLENFEQAIRRVKHLIVIFGQVAPTWLLGRIRKAAKIVAEQFEAGQNTLEGVWIYRLPGCTGSLDLPRMPFQVQILDNGPYPSLEPRILTPLLSSLS